MFIGRTMGRQRRWFLGGFVSIRRVLFYLLIASFAIYFAIARPDLDPKYLAQRQREIEAQRQHLIEFCRPNMTNGWREVPSPQCREVLHPAGQPVPLLPSGYGVKP